VAPRRTVVRYVLNGESDDESLNALFEEAWPHHTSTEFAPLLAASLVYVIAYRDEALVGFVRVVACGPDRAFVFGPTVRPDCQHQGIGTALLNEAADAAEQHGVRMLHVEFNPQHREFFAKAGFKHTAAGIRRLHPEGT
jgi:ribosomal protein S18 acetylase RimI-like enzyme